jgi:metallo-beta-lactamase class B
MPRAWLAAGKTATDSNEIPQGPTELVGTLAMATIRLELWYSLHAGDFAYTPPMRQSLLITSRIIILVLAAAGCVFAQADPDWTEPFPPFRIADNLYYVGSKGLANYLVTTPQGNILINSDLEANVPLIEASIEKLGFNFKNTKILLISHAHWDHDAGSAKIKEMTGAKYMVMDADVAVVESGGKTDFEYGNSPTTFYRPARVDHVLHDREEVKLGGTVLVAHLTPGHTKGCTTWTMQVTERGKTYNVVILGSPNVNPGYRLVDNKTYPEIAKDYERMWRVLKSLPCDIFLGAHGSYFGLEEKYSLMKEGSANPFVDPSGYKGYIAQKEQDFLTELARQKLTAK